MTKRLLLFLPFLLSLNFGFAQLNKANSYFNNYEYFKAIPLYKKAVKKDSSIEALQRLADCYRLLKDYKHAEEIYEKAVQKSGIAPINYFYYGLVLKSNSKISEAKEQFQKYALLAPDDKKNTVSLKSCDDIKIWITRPLRFEVKNAKQLNTKYAEFSPVYYKNKIVFTTERQVDKINFESTTMNNLPYLKVYYTVPKEVNGSATFSRPRLFPGPVNSDYHDGPASFDGNNTIYSTRVYNYSKGANFINRPKIMIFPAAKKRKTDLDWDKPQEFPYNSDDYNMEHPFISPDGDVLYFTSDMPGGYGGNDIWMSRKKEGKWEKPENLGPEVNTAGNESFPCVRKDGILYFSSDGQPGFGGLDIFSATFENNKWGNVTNLGLPLNSPTDDFGIAFSDDMQSGYFSSDRPGGSGSDDIYSFSVSNKTVDVSGKILLSQKLDDPAKNVKLYLMTEDGTVINFTTSDSLGFFKFENLSPDLKYVVKMDENDPVLKGRKKLYMSDNENAIVRVTVINEKGDRFLFRNLPSDHKALTLSDENDSGLALEGRMLFGEDKKPLVNARISLMNEAGEMLKTTITNSIGSFVFTEVPEDQKYLIKLEENDYLLPPNTKITVLNKSGEIIFSTVTDERGFHFELLQADLNRLKLSEEEDVKLKMSMSGRLLSGMGTNKPLADTRVNLFNEKGEVIESVYTDADGNFKFTKLPPDQNFFVRVNAEDPKLAKLPGIVLTDEKGRTMGELIHDDSGTFEYSYLAADHASLSLMGVDDSQLRFKMKGTIVNGDGSNRGLADTKVDLLNEKGEIIQSVRTDANGKFVFRNLPPDKNYFIKADEKDPALSSIKILLLKDEAGTIVKEIHLEKKNGFRFSLIGMDVKVLALMEVEDGGLKSDLLGKLILADGSKNAMANKRIDLINEKGEVVDSTVTDAEGQFVFKNLPADQKFLVKLPDEDVALSDKFKLILKDEHGNDMPELGSTKDGVFQYELLTADRNLFALTNENDGKMHLSLKGRFLTGDSLRETALSNSKVSLYDLKNHLLKTIVTDKNGRFSFYGLPPDQQFVIKMDENDSRLISAKRLVLADLNGTSVRVLRNKKDRFRFELLHPDMQALSSEEVDDSYAKLKSLEKKLFADGAKDSLKRPVSKPGANFTLPPDSGLFESIYFAFGSSVLLPDAIRVLNKIAKFISETSHTILEIDGYSDCRGSERFNLFLSDHRAQEVKNYLVFKGVNVNRLKGVAYGESRPVNGCVDNVECTEEQHALNRRAEFKILMYYYHPEVQR